ncbi:MAG TPA: class I SAM-dependent methyltransferase [Longimicrobiales bacterium]|nr:class I SAM-dependent methyltransferase [Longimicrobiales bacterium]
MSASGGERKLSDVGSGTTSAEEKTSARETTSSDDATSPGHLLYTELASLWHVFSPPEDYAEEAATFRRRFQRLGVPEGGSVLHLGSGGGSVDWHLKQHYRVAGVDLSPAMLAEAERVNPEVVYVRGDMRTVRLGHTFDAVLVHDAIAYMTSPAALHAVYATAAAHLAPGSALVSLTEEIRERMPLPPSVTRVERDGVELHVMETYHDVDPDDHEFEATYVFLIRRGDNVRVEVDRHTVGVHALDEYLAAARATGFTADAEEWELSDWGEQVALPLLVGVKE